MALEVVLDGLASTLVALLLLLHQAQEQSLHRYSLYNEALVPVLNM